MSSQDDARARAIPRTDPDGVVTESEHSPRHSRRGEAASPWNEKTCGPHRLEPRICRRLATYGMVVEKSMVLVVPSSASIAPLTATSAAPLNGFDRLMVTESEELT